MRSNKQCRVLLAKGVILESRGKYVRQVFAFDFSGESRMGKKIILWVKFFCTFCTSVILGLLSYHHKEPGRNPHSLCIVPVPQPGA